MAGCAYADLERMVAEDGVGSTLARGRARVFQTVAEAKGRRRPSGGSTTFDAALVSLANLLATSHMVYRSSGSRGPATRVSVDIVPP